ncbi:hypothetical protein B0H19DRAFT_1120710 [Mycena capillaripes]|nr:hypothetical protein B0H19DRAFT_1120710 [Mycena capillaripes]
MIFGLAFWTGWYDRIRDFRDPPNLMLRKVPCRFERTPTQQLQEGNEITISGDWLRVSSRTQNRVKMTTCRAATKVNKRIH